ncbi:nitric oxide reductase activation protein NorD [Shewanella subflava]|uniref:VWA domain-containing protein n=1 Tax=Shewanella subflava TaxID=2986476 RepID=A0ABT3IDG0_9GAMM|nr:VWA domain-containing protein [Shewanella subflava]MCW3173903.1 VWA domain-containing protein [Shewanella subflava]
MEEVVGKIWDKWITSQVTTDHVDTKVHFSELQSQLLIYYRAMGGDGAKSIEMAEKRELNIHRSTMQKIAGSHKQFYVSWQDERSLRLPPYIALFTDKNLNQSLYFWLTALAAQLDKQRRSAQLNTHDTNNHDANNSGSVLNQNDWFNDNQQATCHLITEYAGLRRLYSTLAHEVLRLRSIEIDASLKKQPTSSLSHHLFKGDFFNKDNDLEQAEKAIATVLKIPGVINQYPPCSKDVLPVPLWLYPPIDVQGQGANFDPMDEKNNQKNSKRKPGELQEIEQRKKAQYADDNRKTDGLLVFQAEALMTWTEQINLDRCQSDEDDDADVTQIAKDLDIISLSRHRKANAARIRFDLDLPAAAQDDLRLGDGILLPEWDYKQQRLVDNACVLQTMISDDVEPMALSSEYQKLSQDILALFAHIGLTPNRRKAQPSGDEIDLDAWIDNFALPVKDSSKQAFYIDTQHQNRDVNCLILADLSLSTEAYIDDKQRVIDVIRDSLMVFSEALTRLGDDFALYGFSSVRSQHVRFHIFKNFDMPHSDHVRGRIARIEPGYYTRMGAAIRQSSQLLSQRGGANKVLLIITDGKPNDLDQYEGRYGIEDTRQAIVEAKLLGLVPYCVTIDKKGHDYLPYLFGSNGFAIVSNASELPRVLPKIYLHLTAVH